MSKRLCLSLEQVDILSQAQHAAIAGLSGNEPPSEDHPLLAREPRLLDIGADGTPIIEPKRSLEDAQRERVIRMWEERGDFADVHEADIGSHEAPPEPPAQPPLERLKALLTPTPDAPKDEQPESSEPPRNQAGTIREAEFVQVRDGMLRNLDNALFNTELAQSILGMLIQSARGVATPADAEAQNEFMLEPNSLSLSSLSMKNPGHLPAHLAARSRKVVLSQTQGMVRNAADILDTGAAEIRRCLEPGKARWHALAEVQRRGWKLTPGRPLVDMERLDTVEQRGNILFGFGAPVLMGDGSVRDEGARDAWIGYGLPEAPLPLLMRTLAYYLDDVSETQLAFPDRSWTRLRVVFCERKDGAERVWISGNSHTRESSVDGQLYDAQLDAVDAELFREIAAHSGVLSSVFPRSVSETCVAIPLSSSLEVRFELEDVPQGEQEPSDDQRTESPIATLLLSVLRLRMLRSWSAQAAAVVSARPDEVRRAPRTSLPAPLWDLFQYTLFLSRLRAIIEDVIKTHPSASVDWRPYDLILDVDRWAAALFDVSDDARCDNLECGGTVLVYASDSVVAQFVLKAPSDMLVYFPQHSTHAGTGMRLSVEIEQVGPLLAAELDMHIP